MITASGRLPRGAEYLVEVPAEWNGGVFVYSHGQVSNTDPPNTSDGRIRAWLLGEGFAVAGSCYRPEARVRFWQLEEAFEDQQALLEELDAVLGRVPDVVVAWGQSIGGLITAGLVQTMGDRLSGAMPLCGPLAGGVITFNVELDCAFVFATLVGTDASLDVVNIRRPEENLRRALGMLREAQATPLGRARIALAAAVTNFGAWADPMSPQPSPTDVAATQRNQFRWFASYGFSVYFWARAQVEKRAGGNVSWNTGVEYDRLLSRSVHRAEVETLYQEAGTSLDDDLVTLAEMPRIEAERPAVDYLARYVTIDGDIDVPVLTMHTVGDGLCGTAHPGAYRDAVLAAGRSDNLRQLYVRRGGHCSFTVGEVVAGIHLLLDRIRTGTWGDVDAGAVNRYCAGQGPEDDVLAGHGSERSGTGMDPAFTSHEPPGLLRADP